jgi:hypothetical protein
VLIALSGPVLKLIGLRRSLDVIPQLVCSGQVHAAALIYSECLPTARNLRLSFSHGEIARIGIWIDTHHINAVLQQCERCIRSVDLKDLVLSKVPHAEIHLSFRELDLNGLIVQIEKTKAGLRRHPHDSYIQVQLGLSALVRIQIIPGSKRPIPFRWSPIVCSSRLHRNVPVDVVEPCNASRWVLLRESAQREKRAKACGNCQSFCFCFKCLHHNGVSLHDRCSLVPGRF